MALDHQAKRDFKVVGTRVARPDGIDKVTGKAAYGADITAPGMLFGRILRSPHAHARIKSIDVSEAAKAPGVKAIVTSADLATPDDEYYADIRDNCLAAVAATSKAAAKAAIRLIKVDYEILPHVTDVDEAMKPDAPVVQEGRALENVPAGMSQNVTSHFEFGHGDLDAGFAKADKIIERTFKTAATHQGYIEPQACMASLGTDGRGEVWCCTQASSD